LHHKELREKESYVCELLAANKWGCREEEINRESLPGREAHKFYYILNDKKTSELSVCRNPDND